MPGKRLDSHLFRSGFKIPDQVQGQGAGRPITRSIHGYVSIYRRSATQPLGLRCGFEATSNRIAPSEWPTGRLFGAAFFNKPNFQENIDMWVLPVYKVDDAC